MSRLREELFLPANISECPILTAAKLFILPHCLLTPQALHKYQLPFVVSTSRQIRHSFLESLYRMFRSQNSQKCLCGMLRKSYSSSSNPRVLDVHRMISFAMMHLYFGKKHAQHILHCQINKKK